MGMVKYIWGEDLCVQQMPESSYQLLKKRNWSEESREIPTGKFEYQLRRENDVEFVYKKS